MARLKRDFGPMRKTLLLSQARVHVIVEGREVDSYLYDKVCRSMFDSSGIEFRIVRGDELRGGGGGGKCTLLEFFDYLKHYSALEARGRYTTIFFLDKDTDDLYRRRRRSPHVCYTPSYDIENGIVESADLQECAAAAMSLPASRLKHLSQTVTWCVTVQQLWKEWVALCLCAQDIRVKHVNYSRCSLVNDPLHSSADNSAVETQLQRMHDASGMPFEDVHKRYRQRLSLVTRKIAQQRGGEVFKGKWYLHILASELLMTNPGGRNFGELRSSLQATVLYQCDPQAPYFDFIRMALNAGVSGLGINLEYDDVITTRI